MRTPISIRRVMATVLVMSILAVSVMTSACAPPKREQLVKIAGYGQQLSGLLSANATLPDSLLQQGVINQQKHDEIVGIFTSARAHIDAFNAGMTKLLAAEKPDYGALTSAVADIIADVQKLDVGVSSDAYKKTLAAVEISLRAVATFFALQIKQARAAGLSDRGLALYVDLDSARAVEKYAAAS